MRKKRLAKNVTSSFVLQITSIVCGLILPRLIIKTYGSEINGLVTSITQFLAIISFLELGMGAVVQSALYKPLSNKDNNKISKIIVSAEKFFKKIAIVLLIYILLLMLFYPLFLEKEFTSFFSTLLIFCISISYFAQYYFGVVDRLLLTADQRGYIQYNAQTITLLGNTVACVLLIQVGASIHLVKLTTSLIYLLRPIFLRWYVNHHYFLNRKIVYEEEPIKQKWNGVAQHIAAVVLDGTDSIVLTLFSTLTNVSIYSVYHLVVMGVKQLFLSLISGIQALVGELWARQEIEELKKTFGWIEWILHNGTIFVFGCVGVLILPFVTVYTDNVTDVNYIQPLFAVLITLANAGHCLRLPYNILILAAGHYKQTQSNYIVATLLNIVISIITVSRFGLIGVAIGTLVAMVYQTLWMVIYNSKNLIKWSIKNFIKQIIVDITIVVLATYLSSRFELVEINYLQWGILALKVGSIWLIIVIIINIIFFREKILYLIEKVLNTIRNIDT